MFLHQIHQTPLYGGAACTSMVLSWELIIARCRTTMPGADGGWPTVGCRAGSSRWCLSAPRPAGTAPSSASGRFAVSSAPLTHKKGTVDPWPRPAANKQFSLLQNCAQIGGLGKSPRSCWRFYFGGSAGLRIPTPNVPTPSAPMLSCPTLCGPTWVSLSMLSIYTLSTAAMSSAPQQ